MREAGTRNSRGLGFNHKPSVTRIRSWRSLLVTSTTAIRGMRLVEVRL